MRKVFADTLFWMAIVKPRDAYARAAQEARQAVGPCLIVTTDEVLSEFLTAFSESGSKMRARAVRTVESILNRPSVKVLAQSHDSFLRAIDRFSNRADKEYSLADCSSMNAMDAENIRDVLTNDHHFVQEGYNVLIHTGRSETAP